MTIIEQARELLALAEKATPGPWFTVEPPWLPRNAETYIIAGHPDPHAGKFVCDFEDCDTLDDDERNHWDNAAHIAAANPAAVAALCRALIARTEALRELVECADSLRDFVAEGGSRHMIGATQAIIDADRAMRSAARALAEDGREGRE